MYGLKPTADSKTILARAVSEFERQFPGVVSKRPSMTRQENIILLTTEVRSREEAVRQNTAFGEILEEFGLIDPEPLLRVFDSSI